MLFPKDARQWSLSKPGRIPGHEGTFLCGGCVITQPENEGEKAFFEAVYKDPNRFYQWDLTRRVYGQTNEEVTGLIKEAQERWRQACQQFLAA